MSTIPNPLASQGIAPPPENPILAEIDRAHASLSPEAQQAIHQAHGIAGTSKPEPAAPVEGIKAPSPSMLGSRPETPRLGGGTVDPEVTEFYRTHPGRHPMDEKPDIGIGNQSLIKAPTSSPLGASMPSKMPESAPSIAAPSANQRELSRLQTTGSGVSQIKNPWARVPLQILDAVGRGFFPGVEMGIPGGSGHHDVLLHQQQAAVHGEQEIQDEEAKRELERAQAEHARAEANTTKAEQPHTLVTAEGIMQWNPGTKRFDIPAGQSPAKEEVEGKTVTTDQGVMQWNPKTKTYDIRVGGAAEKEGAEKTLQDADGVWYHIGKDHAATPITVDGKPFQGKAPAEHTENAEEQFVKEYQSMHKGATIAEAQHAYGHNQQQPPQRDPDVALDRETTRFAKPHEKSITDATAQLEKIADARAMVNGSAEAQALGIPKVLTALVSGAGSGVRITQAELNTIGTARGVKGDVEGWLNSLSGKGKLTAEQQHQLTDILDSVRARVQQKQAIANEALDKINGARSRQEIIDIDKQTRKALQDLEKGGGQGTAKVRVQIPGHDPGEIDASQKDAFLKKYPNAKVLSK